MNIEWDFRIPDQIKAWLLFVVFICVIGTMCTLIAVVKVLDYLAWMFRELARWSSSRLSYYTGRELHWERGFLANRKANPDSTDDYSSDNTSEFDPDPEDVSDAGEISPSTDKQ